MTCNICKLVKDEEDFAWRNKARDQRHRRCRECVAGQDRARYEAGPERKATVYEQRKANIERNLLFVRQYLSTHPCVDCQESDMVVLEFDHIRDKVKAVSKLAHEAVSLERLSAEIAKCEVRCANCHRRKTHERAGGWVYANEVFMDAQ